MPDLPDVPTSLLDESPDLNDHRVVRDLFAHAADQLANNPQRTGSLVDLPEAGSVVLTGDLHDHQLNFRRILKYADLDQQPDRHLVLHELVHGPALVNGRDLSVRILARVASLVLRYPGRVHAMMGNHEIAQFTGERITKDGVGLIDAFDAGIDYIFAEEAGPVRSAANRFIRSMPLAVRARSAGVMCSHSLPAPRSLDGFDPGVVFRPVSYDDLAGGGSAHQLVWGRNLNDRVAMTLGVKWDVRWFVLGHQPAEEGWLTQGDHVLVLASNHDRGVLLPLDLARSPESLDQLADQIVPLCAIAV